MYKKQLSQKLEDRTAVVGVIGLGYVGLPLMLRYAEEGYRVIGFDTNHKKIENINSRKSYVGHIPDSAMMKLGEGEATADFSKISQVDFMVICVPTPLSQHMEPDLSYIVDTMVAVEPYLKKGQMISLESTTYPGTTQEEIVPRVENLGFKIGEDFFVVYSPEREDPANSKYSTKTIPKICGGHTEACLNVGKEFYEKAIDHVVCVSSTQAAEMTKLLENIHRAINIGLVNELKIVTDRMGIDIHEVINAAATKPFGFTPYYPGPGLGGHCIPIDPFYLTWKAKEYNLHTRFIELAGQVNRNMPQFVMEKISLALNDMNLSVKNSKILLLGMSYKKNVDDTRESPSMEIAKLLNKLSAKVYFSDPHFTELDEKNYGIKLESAQSVELSAENLKNFDLAVLLTDHDDFPYDDLLEHLNKIVDSRGRFPKSPKVIKA